jgi:N-acetylglutamate synthase-like GNAT family acetyltransferase
MSIPLRNMKAEDIPELTEMLKQEGTKLEKEEMMPVNTYVWDEDGIKGFFHFRFEQNIPSLRHLVIKKEFRNIKNAAMIIDEWKKVIKGLGFNHSIVLTNKPYLQKLVEFKLKGKPYSSKDYVTAYCVEV